jgi:pimeloyl-ACP methyl ester carboxylesterase
VPLDYAAPDAQAITLALFRRPAAHQPAEGVLFVNPGGPGAPGRAAAAWLDAAALPAYDLIGWDPRGTGDSTPVVCSDDRAIDDLRALDYSPDDEAEEQALLNGWLDFGEACMAGSGQLLLHISTQDTVADLDLLRQLFGAPTLNYLGYSYGTYIGALYADTYPEKVGRLVLDSPVNLTDDESITQTGGFEAAFVRFTKWCAATATCPLGSDADAIVESTQGLLNHLDHAPLPVDDRLLTQSLAVDGVARYLYSDASAYPALTHALAQALAGDGRTLLESADSLWERQSGTYSGLFSAFNAIRCRDHPDTGIDGAFAEWLASARDAPLFGTAGGLDVACVQWPVLADPEPDITVTDAPPILIVGSTGDSATPYEYALWMAERIASATLVTYDGPGHATYGNNRSRCVDDTVEAYLNTGVVPGNHVVCT